MRNSMKYKRLDQSRRTLLTAAAMLGVSPTLHSQDASNPAPATRTAGGFTVASGKSRKGEPLLLRAIDPITVKLSAQDTGGALVIFETTTSPGDGPGLHKHVSQDEWWYVLDGEFVFQVGTEKFRAARGASVFGPRQIPHSFLSIGTIPGKMLISFQPAGQIEEMFEEYAKLTTALTAGRQPERPPQDGRYGIYRVGPRVTP
jgi:mannose-6-phosphate isomerase-like protein (cupin superfamily)